MRNVYVLLQSDSGKLIKLHERTVLGYKIMLLAFKSKKLAEEIVNNFPGRFQLDKVSYVDIKKLHYDIAVDLKFHPKGYVHFKWILEEQNLTLSDSEVAIYAERVTLNP